MEQFALIKDLAIIMMAAGAITLLFRWLHQPPILGYLIAGVLIGPYTLSAFKVTDVHTINLLADLGLVMLLFGLGLEFSWSKIRNIGLAVIVIGAIEILTMVYIGFGVGKLLHWSTMDSIFLGAAMQISSSALIVKTLRDMGKLNLVFSRLVVGILIVEDFAAVVMITLLSAVATTGAADLLAIGSLVLRLVVFVAATLTLGAVIVPRLFRFTRSFHSREALLITGLALCFALALLSKYLGLSVAAGAFLMGSLIGDTEKSEEIVELVAPIRDMFAAIFFVAIGMLTDITRFTQFAVPAIIVAVLFIVGKILTNGVATFMSGYNGSTALKVGMGMPQMGEFSLAIAKQGVDQGAVVAPLYPVIAVVTALTTVSGPYITRSADSLAALFERRAPTMLREYISRLEDWLQAIRTTFARDSESARRVRHHVRMMLINFLILAVFIGVGTFAVSFIEYLAQLTGIRTDVVGLVLGFLLLILCLPPFLMMWRNLHALVDQAAVYVLRRRRSARMWEHQALRVVLRDSILVVLSVFVVMWFIPFIAGLLSIGSYASVIPILLLALVLYLTLRSVRRVYGQVERTFSRILLGQEENSDLTRSAVADGGTMLTWIRKIKGTLSKADRSRFGGGGHLMDSRESLNQGLETGDSTTRPVDSEDREDSTHD